MDNTVKRTNGLLYRIYDFLSPRTLFHIAMSSIAENTSSFSDLDVVMASVFCSPFSKRRCDFAIFSNRYCLCDLAAICSLYISMKAIDLSAPVRKKKIKALKDFFKLPSNEVDAFLSNRGNCMFRYCSDRAMTKQTMSNLAFLMLQYDVKTKSFMKLPEDLPLVLTGDFLFSQRLQFECDVFFNVVFPLMEKDIKLSQSESYMNDIELEKFLRSYEDKKNG